MQPANQCYLTRCISNTFPKTQRWRDHGVEHRSQYCFPSAIRVISCECGALTFRCDPNAIEHVNFHRISYYSCFDWRRERYLVSLQPTSHCVPQHTDETALWSAERSTRWSQPCARRGPWLGAKHFQVRAAAAQTHWPRSQNDVKRTIKDPASPTADSWVRWHQAGGAGHRNISWSELSAIAESAH
jgi:hypothetical protein